MLRILLYNIGYSRGIRSPKEHLLHCNRLLHCAEDIRRRIEEGIADLIDEEDPDLCCFLEIQKHTRLPHLLRSYPHWHVANKYGLRSILRHLPGMRGNCNGFCSKHEFPHERHYLHAGRKKLVHEIMLPGDVSLFLLHASLGMSARRKQMEEICTLTARTPHAIICGDFNASPESGELEILREHQFSFPLQKKPTFPSLHPRRAIDLFLTRNVEVLSYNVLQKADFSDHVPVMVTVKKSAQ